MENTSLEDMIERVRQQRVGFGRGYPMQPPCPEARILALPSRVERELGGTVPARYLDLLRIADGIAENALMIYASETARDVVSDVVGYELRIVGILEANRFYRDQEEAYRDLIVFACREEYLYAQVIETGEYIKILETELEGPALAMYETFDHMMIAAIQSALVT